MNLRLCPEIVENLQMLKGWRRHLHQHPETAFNEDATARFVADRLVEFGLKVHTGIAVTGVVGVLQRGRGTAVLGLRADMDALPMTEQNTFAHASTNPGIMHGCGHDGHTTMLLAAAGHLAAHGRFNGTVVFIFQPGEENENGAKRMIEDDLFRRFPVDAVFGLHNHPGMPLGKAATRTGAITANFDVFDLKIHGRGTHSAMPHTGVDPIVVGSDLVGALQTIISRSIDPLQPAVLSVTRLQAGSSYNIIPDTATLSGSVRTTLPDIQAQIEERIRKVSAGICQAYGAKFSLSYERRYPATVNTAQETARAADAAKVVMGADNVDPNCDPLLGSEDFAWMLQAKPGAYIFLGSKTKDKPELRLHSPGYDFEDELIPIGASYWVRLVEQCLPDGSMDK